MEVMVKRRRFGSWLWEKLKGRRRVIGWDRWDTGQLKANFGKKEGGGGQGRKK
jgi:hypothetical protein